MSKSGVFAGYRDFMMSGHEISFSSLKTFVLIYTIHLRIFSAYVQCSVKVQLLFIEM
jgi:hypothetical protein